MVGARLADPVVGVVVDRRHPLLRGHGCDFDGAGAGDEIVAGKDVVDQLQPTAIELGGTAGVGTLVYALAITPGIAVSFGLLA